MGNQLSFDFSAPRTSLPQLWSADDIYRTFSAEVLETFSEDRRLELKSPRTEAKDIAQYLSMFGNTLPDGGVIVIGVENDKTISGCKSLSADKINKIDEMRVYCSDAKWISKNIEITNHNAEDDFIICIRVYYRNDKLVEMTNGDAFIREGRTKRKLTEVEKREIQINKGQVDFEMEACNLKWPDDFDMNLVRAYCNEYKSKRNIDNPELDDILIWSGLSASKSNTFMPNVACALLFAKNPETIIPGARIRFIRYDGKEERFGKNQNIVNDAYIEGPIPRQIESAEKLIQSQMRNFTRLGADGKFYTRPEYPKDAWLEAVVNACVHRSYNFRHMNIFVKMFDDQFVVESPGGFLPPTTAETVYRFHNPRNSKLMGALFYLDFVKCAYEGTRRMRDEMLESELPAPEFSQKDLDLCQVHVRLRNDVESMRAFAQEDVAASIGVAIFESLSKEEKVILNVIHVKEKLSVNDVVRVIGKDWRKCKQILEGLRNKGILDLKSRSGKERESSKRYVLKARRANGH